MYCLNRISKSRILSLLLLLLLVKPVKAESKTTLTQELETAKVQANLGNNYWKKGNIHQAISAWKKEAEIYHLQGLTDREAEVRLKIAQGYLNSGQFRLAIIELEKNLSLTKKPSLIARTWKQLGNAYTQSGKFSEATSAYRKSLVRERNLSTLNNLIILLQKQNIQAKLKAKSARKGQETERYVAEAKSYQAKALKYAEQALSLSKTEQSSSAVRALIEWGKMSPIGLSTEQLRRVGKILSNLSSSRTKVFLAINWAKLDSEQTQYWLHQAREIAKTMGDAKAESYALLELGYLHEQSGDTEQALKYAYAAQLKAQFKFAFGSLYRAHWLAGRIYRQVGNKEAALSNYRNAIAALDAFNQGLSKIDIKQRLDFKEKIEPIYRGMLDLLLDGSVPLKSNLKEALFIFDKLRLAQLQQYFGDNCFELEQESLAVKELLASKKCSVNQLDYPR